MLRFKIVFGKLIHCYVSAFFAAVIFHRRGSFSQMLNLAVEKQAIGRVHRLGQTRPVTVSGKAAVFTPIII